MGKIISASWAEKDDPMFTGRFTISSKKQSQKKEASNNLRRRLEKQFSQGCDNKDPLVIAIEENPKSFKEVYAETPAAKSHKKED